MVLLVDYSCGLLICRRPRGPACSARACPLVACFCVFLVVFPLECHMQVRETKHPTDFFANESPFPLFTSLATRKRMPHFLAGNNIEHRRSRMEASVLYVEIVNFLHIKFVCWRIIMKYDFYCIPTNFYYLNYCILLSFNVQLLY